LILGVDGFWITKSIIKIHIMIRITKHPPWAAELLKSTKPYEDRIVNSRIFNDMASGVLSITRFRAGLINFYPFIENFPKYMALNLAKVPAGDAVWNKKTRFWLISNLNQERVHTGWWKQWAFGFGVPTDVFDGEISPPAEMDAINNYLWRVCGFGSLAEGISAAHFAVEGVTGLWTKKVRDGIKKYSRVKGVKVTERTLEWIEAHASYDDKHPQQALEILKAIASTETDRMKIKQAAIRTLEYYALALDACYDGF
jgi:pyrroloquinoline quinone (PQQ) biosynthesis protein C